MKEYIVVQKFGGATPQFPYGPLQFNVTGALGEAPEIVIVHDEPRVIVVGVKEKLGVGGELLQTFPPHPYWQ